MIRPFTGMIACVGLISSAIVGVLALSAGLTGQANSGAIRFADATASAKIAFRHNSGRAGKKWLPETMGAGAAWFDMDGDGDEDLLLINSKSWSPKPQKSLHALYRNEGNGSFTNTISGSGLDVEMFGMGVAVGDYDNDGRGDVYITAIDGDKLFHNEGNGKFRDVTKTAGIDNVRFGTSAAWLDYDRDGQLDLFVGNYVAWTAKGDLWCSLDGQTKSYCTPESYKGVAPKLYKNQGGKFTDVAAKAGLGDPNHKTLGVALLDYNADGWIDLFVANDTQQNRLYRNNKNGTFTDDGLSAGVAFGEDGVARGAMGADAGDYDRSGKMHLLVGNFTNQMLALYHNEGNGLFVDESPRSNMGKATLLNLTFGAFFFDYDLDGYLDIFCANGHIEEEINRVQPKVQFRQAPSMFRNRTKGKFEDTSKQLGVEFGKTLVARGAAFADYDKDGDLDVVITQNNGPAVLYRNDGGNKNRWLQVKAIGTKSNRDAIGTVIEVQSPSGKQMQMVKTGSSYCSQSELALTFGLGGDQKVDSLTVKWPNGQVQKLTGLPVNKRIVIEEGKGWRPA